MRPRLFAASALAAGLLVPLATAAQALPNCTAATQAACGNRIVPEPVPRPGSPGAPATSFVQYDGTAEDLGVLLQRMEALPGAARYLEVMTMAEATGDATHISKAGRPIWVVRVTDETVTTPKAQAAISLSVHGLEAAGREGGVRYVEDLARWSATPTRMMYSGDVGFPYSEVMAKTESWIAFTNPDGWANGDLDSTTPGGFTRGNSGGFDLNRDLATVGWYDRTGGRGIAESEPETRAWTTIVKGLTNLKTSSDIHGELTTPNGAYSDLIIPAGQWTPKKQEQVDQFSLRMIRSVERKFTEDGVALGALAPFTPATGATPTRPANVAAAYDIVGYDDSGFMGDWFSQTRGSTHMDIENFLSNLAPNNAFSGVVEQSHVAAVRGNMESTIVEALITDSVVPSLTMKRVAYVDDPNRVTSADGTLAPTVAGETQVPYDVNRLRYLEVLEQTIGRPVDAVTAAQVAAGSVDLSAYDSLVVSDMPNGLPAGSTVDPAVYRAKLDQFAQNGGQLVLTDRSLGLLDDLGVVPTSALTVNRTDAGHVDFLAPVGDHPYERGLVGLPSQTYYEVMLGFPSRTSTPNYGVTRAAWTAAGGETVATVAAQGANSTNVNTALGRIPRGQGRITILGALLPQAIEQLVREDGTTTVTPHPFGLADYAVTITGGQVFDNILAYDANVDDPIVPNPGDPAPVVPEVPAAALLPLAALGTAAAAWGMARRRSRAAL